MTRWHKVGVTCIALMLWSMLYIVGTLWLTEGMEWSIGIKVMSIVLWFVIVPYLSAMSTLIVSWAAEQKEESE